MAPYMERLAVVLLVVKVGSQIIMQMGAVVLDMLAVAQQGMERLDPVMVVEMVAAHLTIPTAAMVEYLAVAVEELLMGAVQ